MFPFAPAPGTITGVRPTAQFPDAHLSEDDRTGLRVLYHDPLDTLYLGSIQGHILPANPVSPVAPTGVTGIFAAHVVVVDASTGSVIAGSMVDGVATRQDLCNSMEIIRSIVCR